MQFVYAYLMVAALFIIKHLIDRNKSKEEIEEIAA
jgi:hypothetical protein